MTQNVERELLSAIHSLNKLNFIRRNSSSFGRVSDRECELRYDYDSIKSIKLDYDAPSYEFSIAKVIKIHNQF